MRLIDADKLQDWLEGYAKHGSDDHLRRNARDLMKHVDERPTIECATCGNGEGSGGDCAGTFWAAVRRPGQRGGTGCSAWAGRAAS